MAISPTSRPLALIFFSLLLGGCGGGDPDAHQPPGGAPDSPRPRATGPVTELPPPDPAKLSELDARIRDRAASREERRAALEEKARLLGRTLPASPPELSRARRRIEISLPEGPPTGDPVEPGRWVLSLHLELASGEEIDDHLATTLELDGEELRLKLDRSTGKPISGRLRAGRVRAVFRESGSDLELTGQVTGAGRLAGGVRQISSGEGPRLRQGRWRLTRVE